MEIGASRYGLWLNDRGKIEGDSYVVKLGEANYLLVSVHTGEEALTRLVERHIIADDVEIESWNGLRKVYAVPTEAREDAGSQGQDTRGNAEAGAGDTIWVCEPRGEAALWLAVAALGAEPLMDEQPELWIEERIRRRIPAIPGEAGPRDTPFDLDLVEVSMSFKKGCYLGQEVMAKLHSRGRAVRRLYRLAGSYIGNKSEGHGAAVVLMNGQDAGRVLCACRRGGEWLGLAQLKTSVVDAGGELGLDGCPEVQSLRIF